MMKTLISILFLLLTLFTLGDAQESALTSAIEQLPACALSCLTRAVVASPCELTNETCICTDAKLNANVEVCVLHACTLRQALTTKNVTSTACHAPIRNKTRSLRLTNIILGAISASFVLTRIIYKAAFSIAELGWDDYLILAVVICGTPSTIITDRGTIANGLGRDVWTLPFNAITAFSRWFYIMEILYFFNIAMLKLSLLFFFLRIFPSKPVRRIVWATIAFNIFFGVSFVLTAMFQCTPIRYNWERWDGEHTGGKCLDINAMGWANASVSIVLDVWMLILPLWQVSHLRLAWKKKVGVAMMFFVGTFVTVVSVLRLQSLIHFATSTNPTWDQADVSNWSTVEINVGIMCACMPAIRIILVRLFPKVLGSTQYGSTNQNYAKYDSHQPSLGHSGNHASALRSRRGNEAPGLESINANGITYTKTFEVQHGDNDEEHLVQMDELSVKGVKVRSSGSSEASVSAASSPIGAYHVPSR